MLWQQGSFRVLCLKYGVVGTRQPVTAGGQTECVESSVLSQLISNSQKNIKAMNELKVVAVDMSN